MPQLGDVEQRIAAKVVSRFLRSNAPTAEHSILTEFKQPKAIDDMVRWGILKYDNNNEALFPKALAFEYCGDADALNLAKQGIRMTLTVFESLFGSSPDKKRFSIGDIKERALSIFSPLLNTDAVDLGLYLIQEFGVLNSWILGAHGRVDNVEINKNIVTFDNAKIDNAWSDHVRQHDQYVGTIPGPILNAYERSILMESEDEDNDVTKPGKSTRLGTLLTKPAIIAAAIAALATIVVALIQYQPWQQHSTPTIALHIAGTVVDSDTNQGIGQAEISLSGRTETFLTEDNGNFRIDIAGNQDDARRLRVRVNKKGYKTYDQSVTPPVGTLMIQLQKP